MMLPIGASIDGWNTNNAFSKDKAGPSSTTASTVLAVPLLSLGPSKHLKKTEILKSVTH